VATETTYQVWLVLGEADIESQGVALCESVNGVVQYDARPGGGVITLAKP